MTKKRGNSEGGLYRRADGLWCGSFTIGYNQEGNRKRRVVYGKTKTEVQKRLLELCPSRKNAQLFRAHRVIRWCEDDFTPQQVVADSSRGAKVRVLA